MGTDDELRRRMHDAAEQAGAGTDPSALGAAVTNSVAAGAGGAAATGASWGLFGLLAAAGLVIGAALGFTALSPETTQAASAITVQQFGLYDCPDGAVVGIAYPGDRVWVIARDEAGAWLQVRDPRDQTQVRWLPAGSLEADSLLEVPVAGCTTEIHGVPVTGAPLDTSSTSTTSSTTSTSTTVAPTTVAPTTVPATVAPTVPPPTTPPPTVPPDTQKPGLQANAPSPNEIFDSSWSANCAATSTITVSATDNIGVTAVNGSWSGLPGSPKAFTKGAGTTWTMTFGPFSGLPSNFNQNTSITITARDAAGNVSNPAQVQVRVWGTCLI